MSYSLFLLLFLVLPIALLALLQRRYLTRIWLLAIGAHMLVALIYTTPWDNYLVATRVWWYDPELVLGITIGWVPIEEYTFFILQPILAGLWLLLMNRIIQTERARVERPGIRIGMTVAIGVLWLISVIALVSNWRPATYLALIWVWSLPPVALQTYVGGDILVQQWRRVLAGLIPVIAFLSAADSLAIRSGTWTIDPEQSLQIYLASVLPIEEFIFFVMTNVLIVFGITLVLSEQSLERLGQMRIVSILGITRFLPTAQVPER